MKELKEKLRAALKCAAALAEKAEAEHRDFTPDEADTVRKALEEARTLKAKIKANEDGDAGIKAALAEFAEEMGGPSFRSAKSPIASGSWAGKVIETVGRKDLIEAGSVEVPASNERVVNREPEHAVFIQDLITHRPLVGDRFSYWRQTTRTNNAAPVARGDVKPTSIFTTQRVEDRARTVAHLSEPMNRADLEDSAFLRDFIEFEMRYGLVVAKDAQILTGPGTGETFTGIHTISGTIAQAWSTDLFETTRKAVTALEATGVQPTAWVFDPADWEKIELLQDNEARYYIGLGGSPADRGSRRLWSLPVVVSVGQTAGQGLLGDFSERAIVIYQRNQARIDWSEATWDPVEEATDFQRNLMRFRAEERWGLAIKRPASFVELDLTA